MVVPGLRLLPTVARNDPGRHVSIPIDYGHKLPTLRNDAIMVFHSSLRSVECCRHELDRACVAASLDSWDTGIYVSIDAARSESYRYLPMRSAAF